MAFGRGFFCVWSDSRARRQGYDEPGFPLQELKFQTTHRSSRASVWSRKTGIMRQARKSKSSWKKKWLCSGINAQSLDKEVLRLLEEREQARLETSEIKEAIAIDLSEIQ